MLRILTAIGNEYINQQLQILNKYDIIHTDLQYQGALIEYINNNEFDVLLMYEKLEGELLLNDFIEKIINTNKNFEIILLIENMNNKTIQNLNLKGIYKIISIDNVSIDLICKKIEEKKEILNTYPIVIQKENEDNIIIKTPKYITVYGTVGSGKTFISVAIGIVLNEFVDKKVLIMDMDILTASVDVFCNINNNEDSSLNKCVENIKKNNFTKENLMKSIYKINTNLYVFSGNTNYYKCQNVLCDEYYNLIIEKIDTTFDYIIFDINSNLFIDATKWCLLHSNLVYCVVEGNYNCIKNMENSLFVLNRIWEIDCEKLKIIENKYNKNSVDKDYIYELLKINCIGKIHYSSLVENAINKSDIIDLIKKEFKEEIMNLLGYKKSKFKILGGNIFDNKSILKR